MDTLKHKIWFKTVAVIVIQLFLLSQSVYALNVDDKRQQQKKFANEGQSDKLQMQTCQDVVITSYSSLASQGHSSSRAEEQDDPKVVVAALEDVPLSVKGTVLKAMDCSLGKAAAALIGGWGFNRRS